MDFQRKEQYDMQDLLRIVTILRQPGGCPWDAEQTHQSIRTNLIEEAYEVADAIDKADGQLLREELGDLLLQIVMHTEMEAEQGCFSFDDVCDGICKKLVYRHPHVFGQLSGLDTGQVLENWEKLKNTEKGRDTAADRLDSVPPSLPALMRSEKMQKRAVAYGYAYADVQGAMADLEQELGELKEAIAKGEGAAQEVGDVLFSTVNVARFLGADAEEALSGSTNRFAGRIKASEEMANAQGVPLKDLDAKTRDVFWKQAKAAEQK